MQIPDEFYDFCLYLHQDFDVVYGPEPQDWIKGALEHMGREQRAALRAYVNTLLTGSYNGEELQAIWRSTDAEISCRDERSLRNFLGMVRDIIDKAV
jgi:hypothetical protein